MNDLKPCNSETIRMNMNLYDAFLTKILPPTVHTWYSYESKVLTS
jgi:hypothetical protein